MGKLRLSEVRVGTEIILSTSKTALIGIQDTGSMEQTEARCERPNVVHSLLWQRLHLEARSGQCDASRAEGPSQTSSCFIVMTLGTVSDCTTKVILNLTIFKNSHLTMTDRFMTHLIVHFL